MKSLKVLMLSIAMVAMSTGVFATSPPGKKVVTYEQQVCVASFDMPAAPMCEVYATDLLSTAAFSPAGLSMEEILSDVNVSKLFAHPPDRLCERKESNHKPPSYHTLFLYLWQLKFLNKPEHWCRNSITLNWQPRSTFLYLQC